MTDRVRNASSPGIARPDRKKWVTRKPLASLAEVKSHEEGSRIGLYIFWVHMLMLTEYSTLGVGRYCDGSGVRKHQGSIITLTCRLGHLSKEPGAPGIDGVGMVR